MKLLWKLPPWFRTVAARRRLKVAAVLLGAGVAGWLVSLLAYPAPLVEHQQRIPLVIGLAFEDAEKELRGQGFRVKVRETRETDPAMPVGHVTWQDPPAYLESSRGTMVELTLSAGPALLPVPDVMFFDLEEARKVLAAAGFSVGEIDSVPAETARGVVVSTRPPTGTARAPGSKVDVVVSRGPAAVSVPDVVGLTELAAREKIQIAGLRIGLVRAEVDGRNKPATVTSQRPRAGSLLPRGGRMDLVVSGVRPR
jgi:beta-lactam-binding protein with PASTA domain